MLYPAGSRASDDPPSSEMSSSSTSSCVSPDVMEGYWAGANLKSGGGNVFVCVFSSDLLAMVTISSSLPFPCV